MQELPNIYERVLPVSSNSEHFEPVTAARLRLNAREIERLFELEAAVKGCKAESIHDWNYAAEWGFLDGDEEELEPGFIPTEEAGDRNTLGEFTSELNQVEVSATTTGGYVCWFAYWKHTSVKVRTVYVNLAELREALEKHKAQAASELSEQRARLPCSQSSVTE